jgi:hypothetical protein
MVVYQRWAVSYRTSMRSFRDYQSTFGFAPLAIHLPSAYTACMNFEWDEQKNRDNIRKHGFSFADAWEVFEAPMLIDLERSIRL